ncbi:MAG TPA: C39 family peptidase [Candidatus Dormibacteraeota bacterium]|nr:C39 family peptidase [Candidatus Dormibacteraeota bacterium]
MSRVILDYGPPGAGIQRARRSRRVTRRPVMLASAGLIAAVLVGGGATFGRQIYHAIRARGTTSSHALNGQQLSALMAISPAPRDVPEPRRAAGAASPTPLPGTAILPVPYTVQAPFNNWKVHEESCEEAALLMYHDFLEGDARAQIPPADADQQLRALKAWQVTNWGAERDLDLEHIGQLAQQYYGYTYQVSPATQANIQAAVAAGHPVVVPVMTHSLMNSNYGPKTVYHVVLIKGYAPGGVVTNDAGIKEGKDWFYSWPVLFSAIDAQTPKMGQGRLMLVLYHP